MSFLRNSRKITRNVDLLHFFLEIATPQPAITCSKLTIGTLEEGVKYVQS